MLRRLSLRAALSLALAGLLAISGSALGATAVAPRAAWTTPQQLTHENGEVNALPIATSADGTHAVLAWDETPPNAYNFTVYASIYSHGTWGLPIALSNPFNGGYIGSAAISSDGSTIVVAWTELNSAYNLHLVREATATNGVFGAARNLDSDAQTLNAWEFGAPKVAVSKDGIAMLAAWGAGEQVQGAPSVTHLATEFNGRWSSTGVLGGATAEQTPEAVWVRADGYASSILLSRTNGSVSNTALASQTLGQSWKLNILSATTDDVFFPTYAMSADGSRGIVAWDDGSTGGFAPKYVTYSNGRWSSPTLSTSYGGSDVWGTGASADGRTLALGWFDLNKSASDAGHVMVIQDGRAPITHTLTSPPANPAGLSLSVASGEVIATWVNSTDATAGLRADIWNGASWSTLSAPDTTGQTAYYPVVHLIANGKSAFAQWRVNNSSTESWYGARLGLPGTVLAPLLKKPTIAKLSPTYGPHKGGTHVVISGANLAGAKVSFGGVAAKVLTRTSTHLTVIAPAHAKGRVKVTVTTAAGAVTRANAYTYR